MKILIDARFWGPGHTGLGVYTKELVTNLAKLDNKNHQYILLVRPDFPSPALAENFSTLVVNAPPYTFKEQVVLALVLLRKRPDLAHFPSINVPVFCLTKFVVTVHDLIKHSSRGVETSTLSQPSYWFKYFVYRWLIFWIALRANKIIVPSQFVARDLEKNYSSIKAKVVVTYEAPTISPDHSSDSPISLPDKFAIYTGNAYPHKNLPFLISAWKTVFGKTKTKLVLVCGRTVFTERIEKMVEKIGAKDWVDFKGYLSDRDLALTYQKATLYVFPTLMEGFGIPGLDAMNCSLPVLCSDIPVLREVYGDAATFFDPTSSPDLTQKAIALLSSVKAREKLVERGLKQVKKYSWSLLAKKTLSVYEHVQRS